MLSIHLVLILHNYNLKFWYNRKRQASLFKYKFYYRSKREKLPQTWWWLLCRRVSVWKWVAWLLCILRTSIVYIQAEEIIVSNLAETWKPHLNDIYISTCTYRNLFRANLYYYLIYTIIWAFEVCMFKYVGLLK